MSQWSFELTAEFCYDYQNNLSPTLNILAGKNNIQISKITI